MESPLFYSAYKASRLAFVLLLAGAVAIYTEMAIKLAFMYMHTVLDVVPANVWLDPDDALYWILVPAIGIPAILLFLFTARLHFRYQVKAAGITAAITFVPASLAVNASLLFGGGWYVGTIMADAGLVILLASFVMLEKVGKPGQQMLPQATRKTQIRKVQAVVLALGCAGIVVSAVVPVIVGINTIPEPLIPVAAALPSVAPDHENTFYIMPIWETTEPNYTLGTERLTYMKEIVGGPTYTGNGFVKIGRSLSCWYMGDLYTNGSYNPANLIHALNLANVSNTPLLFHMNGGNWGTSGDGNPVIVAMRGNVSNCQVDQKGWCPPNASIHASPNNRYWSFCPGTEFEQLKEHNIKTALDVIYNWWQTNPDLLVGFSTDSEIHLRNSFFENDHPDYQSYFDYNNGTIAQFRLWAQNWSLSEFNEKCGKDFATWGDIDAPRTLTDGVGVKGNKWWEIWTDFRIWHVTEAGKRQCKWINESGFPREMIWHHQIFSEPGDESSRYQRCDPLSTAVNPYCKVGVTRYGWISPQNWHSLGQLALNDGSGDEIPSWGIFEWNLWTQHEYWAYKEMLNCIYRYGGHVICPNEWTNCSANEGLWIPGDPLPPGTESEVDDPVCSDDDLCCANWNGTACLQCYRKHGNVQFLAALRDFVSEAQVYERGSCPTRVINKLDVWFYDNYLAAFKFFSRDEGLITMACCWLGSIVLLFVIIGVTNNIRWSRRR